MVNALSTTSGLGFYSAEAAGSAGSGGAGYVSIYWKSLTWNYGYGIMAGGAPPEFISTGCGGGDKYLLGLKPPIAAISAMFVIWIMVFCWPKLLTNWFGEKGENELALE